MTSEIISAQIAALRSTKLTGDEAEELGQFLALNPLVRDDFNWHNSPIAKRLGFNPETMDTVHRLSVAAAALIIAIEEHSVTPFDRWLRSTFSPLELTNFTAAQMKWMKVAFEAGADG